MPISDRASLPAEHRRAAPAGKALRKAERGKSHFEIAAVLGGEILSGVRPPGTRQPSLDEMFQRFGVSRVVVREVMRTLAAKGMVTAKTRIGTRVADAAQWSWLDPQVLTWRSEVGLDRAFMVQLTQVRLALEPAAASLAAQNRTDQDIAAIRAALQGMYRAGGDHQKFSRADRHFHDAIILATHNPFFHASSSATEVALSRFLSAVAWGVRANEKLHQRSAAQHEKILDAILARNPKAAARAMTHVVKDGLKYGPRLLKA